MMQLTMKKLGLKEKAIYYRKKGFSYNMINQKIGVSKSTLSDWLNKVPVSPNKELIKRIGLAKLKSASFKHNQKFQEISEMSRLAEKELGTISKRDLWILGIGLYLGEGSKSNEILGFSNSNPEVIKIMVDWFKKVCRLGDKNFNPYVHAYPDNDIEETINYWSNLTGISKSQFGKTYIDKRKGKLRAKKKTLPYGTIDLRIKSCGEKEFGRKLHRKIIGWIETTTKQINAGIV
jgi:hypothetical protein